HRKRVGGDQQNRKSDRAAQRQQKQLQVAEKSDKVEHKSLLGFSLRRIGRIGKQIVNRVAHAWHVFGAFRLDHVLSDKVTSWIGRGKAFAQIVPVEEEQFTTIRIIEDASQRQF